MKFDQYYNLSESDRDGAFANITKRLDDLESKIDSNTDDIEQDVYTVFPTQSEGGDVLLVVDVHRGVVVDRLGTRGRLISHPVVYDNKCAFAIERDNGEKVGAVYQLPDAQLITQFRLTGDATKGTETSPIFRSSLDTEEIFGTNMRKWIGAADEEDDTIQTLKQLLQIKSTETTVQDVQPAASVPALPEPVAQQTAGQPSYGAPISQTGSYKQPAATQSATQPATQPATRRSVDPAPRGRRIPHSPTASSERIRALMRRR